LSCISTFWFSGWIILLRLFSVLIFLILSGILAIVTALILCISFVTILIVATILALIVTALLRLCLRIIRLIKCSITIDFTFHSFDSIATRMIVTLIALTLVIIARLALILVVL